MSLAIGAVALAAGLMAAVFRPGSIGAASTNAADATLLRRHVDALVSSRVGPRDIDNPQGLDRAAEYIAEALSEHTAEASMQPSAARGATYRNVIARFGPRGTERIVVGAHYDTAGPLPGADDNASGVAGLLELARLLAAEPPPIPVELVAFSLEEPPAFATGEMGSAVHAASLAAGGARVRIMIALETSGLAGFQHLGWRARRLAPRRCPSV